MELSEVAPPGFGHTKGDKKKGVEKGGTAAAFDRARKEGRFKGSKSDMFAIMWSQKNKGDKPHYKPGTDKKYKKYQEEETTYKTRDKELKKTSVARNERYKTLHKKTGEGNVDVNESSYEKLKKKIGSKKMHKEPVVVEGIGDAVKKGVKRHKDAVEKKKIKNRKAVPYAALAAEHQPEGEVVLERDFSIGAKESEKFHTFYKKAKEAKARKQADSTRSDSRKRGIKFGDAKGTGRIRGGKKYYD